MGSGIVTVGRVGNAKLLVAATRRKLVLCCSSAGRYGICGGSGYPRFPTSTFHSICISDGRRT